MMKNIDKLREYFKRMEPCYTAEWPEHPMMYVCTDIVFPMLDLIEHDYEREVADMVPLPIDADGVPIHVGDVMEWPYGNGEFRVNGIGGNTLFYIDKDSGECEWTAAGDKRHHHAPTVEDVLREFSTELWNRYCIGGTSSDCGVRELEAEYAAKLQLKED